MSELLSGAEHFMSGERDPAEPEWSGKRMSENEL